MYHTNSNAEFLYITTKLRIAVSFLIKECQQSTPVWKLACKVALHIPLFQEVDDMLEVGDSILSLHVRQNGVRATLHGYMEEGVDPRVGEDPRHLLEGGGAGQL